ALFQGSTATLSIGCWRRRRWWKDWRWCRRMGGCRGWGLRWCGVGIAADRTALGLSKTGFAEHFRAPVGTLRDREQARSGPHDFAGTVTGKFPETVANPAA